MSKNQDYEVHDMGRSGSFKLSANQWGHYERMHSMHQAHAHLAIASAKNSPSTAVKHIKMAANYKTASDKIVDQGKKTNKGGFSKRGYDKRENN